MHRIDPGRLDLAREFKAKPLGPHSPDLQKLLKIMRWDPIAGRLVAVQPERGGPWHLARLTGPKGHPNADRQNPVVCVKFCKRWPG